MMFWLILAVVIAFVIGSLSWVQPSPGLKAVAKLREVAMQSGWLVKRQSNKDSEKYQVNWRNYSNELMRYSWRYDTPTSQTWAVCKRFGHWQWMDHEQRGHVPAILLNSLKELPDESCMVICGKLQITLVWVESTAVSPQEVLLMLKDTLEQLRTINLSQ